ncbi:3-hydroxyacyl-CoA dehydrogenase NAD-binding domain-containing protein [Streptomyces sp. L7]
MFNSPDQAPPNAGKISAEELAETQARLSFTTDLGEFADRDLVIEAVVENEQVKTEIFQVLDQVVTRAPTRSSPPTPPRSRWCGSAVTTSRPDQVIGIHFFNPAPVQQLVELIPASDHLRGARSAAPSCSPRTCLGQARHPRPGPLRLRGQRAADPLSPLRDPDVRVGHRQPRGHRQRHGAGLRPPDGPR